MKFASSVELRHRYVSHSARHRTHAFASGLSRADQGPHESESDVRIAQLLTRKDVLPCTDAEHVDRIADAGDEAHRNREAVRTRYTGEELWTESVWVIERDRITASVLVEVHPAHEPDGILGQQDPLRTTALCAPC
jgi:hypothetical protein